MNLHVKPKDNVYQNLKYAMVFGTAQMHLTKMQKCAQHVSTYFLYTIFN